MKDFRSITCLLPAVLLLLGACQEKEDPSPSPTKPVVSLELSSRQIILTEQATASVKIFDQPTRTELWSWNAAEDGIPSSRVKWFNLPDEAKAVREADCILLTASGGGVALVRIQPKEVLFYAHPAGNPHSAELLPDGAVVVASSTGNKLTLYALEAGEVYASSAKQTLDLAGAHGVVWDRTRQCLWALGSQVLVSYSYTDWKLTELLSTPLPSLDGHDLVPIYGEDRLLVTTGSNVYTFDPDDRSFTAYSNAASVNAIKSVSTGPDGFPFLCTTPTESWYTPEVLDFRTGQRVFYLKDAQFYKARWRVNYSFSY